MRKFLNRFGVLASVLGTVFVIVRLISGWPELQEHLAVSEPLLLLLSLILAICGMLAIAIPWRLAMLITLGGSRVPHLGDTVRMYFLGEVAKYVPGSVWAVVGRGELLWRQGVRRSHAYSSVVLSLGALYLGCALLTVVLGIIMSVGAPGSRMWILAGVLGLALLGLHHRVLRTLAAAADRLVRHPLDLRIPSWAWSLMLVASYIPAWVLVGAATWTAARALGNSSPYLPIFFATTLSWLAGFALVPAPGGIGAREATFVLASGAFLGPVAPATAILARVLFMLVDLGGAVLASTTGTRARAPESQS
jgi:uncharacterized membrane protein YbhN (UPF0104 family)